MRLSMSRENLRNSVEGYATLVDRPISLKIPCLKIAAVLEHIQDQGVLLDRANDQEKIVNRERWVSGSVLKTALAKSGV